MVDNQHKKISGYRDLTEEEIALMNEAKELEKAVGVFVKKIRFMTSLNQRWISIGQTDLEKGFMGIVRSIAQPLSPFE